ncbi:sigma-70 family RNA polymerase sigma factor [Luteipulveratus sp. YIM 133132]|uniref:sigma-70 family RNA polymerase sigma factor n=1 Tax=Luteipulveratus flavus TaxID=3031728 RepID=UPI0023AEFE79|nr:sigma-70 family RNA polymerase sigma factor [Luteipulveratus sp. YIM 133132]MDE9365722.1 sigma-70 family RNA polymerase sigma factor [Luteipulveratus sp. YIM 133132]
MSTAALESAGAGTSRPQHDHHRSEEPARPVLRAVPDELDTDGLLALAEAAADPREAARLRGEVVLEHQGLARRLARRYAGRGVEQEDLEQVALLALVNATRRYRPGAPCGFVGYAAPTITGEIKRHFRDHGWTVRPPRSLQETVQGWRRAREELTHQLGRTPTRAELADHLGVAVHVVAQAEQVHGDYHPASLHAPTSFDADLTLGDAIPDDAPDRYAEAETMAVLAPALARLTPRERDIVRLRFVENLSQRRIGEQLGVSQMQISRLLRRILATLREQIGEVNAQLA